jgi:hypothetical protein
MKPKNSNRSFGLLFFLIFLGFGLWPLTKGESLHIFLIIISLPFLVLGSINSKFLSPLNKAWLKFGEILGIVIAPIIMALFNGDKNLELIEPRTKKGNEIIIKNI